MGRRLVAELALHDPGLVDRLVLLEPMLHLPPEDGLEAAERERHEETYATAEEAVEALAAAVGSSTPREFLVEEAVEEHLERYRVVLGDRLKVERLASQHWLLWNALAATAGAVRAFV